MAGSDLFTDQKGEGTAEADRRGLSPTPGYLQDGQFQRGPSDDQYRQDMYDRSQSIGRQADMINSGRYAGSMAYRQGVEKGARNNMAMAAGRGMSPSAGRAAVYAGDQMRAEGQVVGKQLDLQEQLARDQMLMDARQRQVAYEQMMQDDATRRYLGALGYQSGREGADSAYNQADSRLDAQMVGIALGSAGAGLGGATANSDERGKIIVDDNTKSYGSFGESSGYQPPADVQVLIGSGGSGGSGGSKVKDDGVSKLTESLQKESAKVNQALAAPPPETPKGDSMAAYRDKPEDYIARVYPTGPVVANDNPPPPRATAYGFYGPPGSYTPPATTTEAAQRQLPSHFYGAYRPADSVPSAAPQQSGWAGTVSGDPQVDALTQQYQALDTQTQQDLSLSDERGKMMKLGRVDAANIETMRGINPELWQYKPEAQAALGLTGRMQAGPTAQNLESTPLGKTVVYETPVGKQVDTKAATLQLLGQNATLQKQLDAQSAEIARMKGARHG